MEKTATQDIPALVIDNVSKHYTRWNKSGKVKDIFKNLTNPDKKEIRALDDLSFMVEKGEFVAYAGANGAGKSTTMKILSGILQPTSGSVTVLGMNPTKQRVPLMKQVGVLFGQRTELWWDQPVITSYEWKKVVWSIPEDVYQKNLTLVTTLLDLSEILTTFSRELSLGQRMRADLGMLLLHSPEVIFLDEPTLGLDVLAKRQMIAFLKTLNQETGTTILVTSHDMNDLEEMANRIILLSKGKLIYDGDFNDLRHARGGFSSIKIQKEGTPPEIVGMVHKVTSHNTHEYEIEDKDLNLNEILANLSKVPEITDIEITKASIENVVAELYLELKS